MSSISRRQLLINIGAMGLMLSLSPVSAWAQPSFTANPFRLGVASGDPLSDGFVIWTRVVPEPLKNDGGMPKKQLDVAWEVAGDPDFKNIIQSGVYVAHPDLVHSVHVELENLKSSTTYWYRFKVASYTSQVGKATTLARHDQNLSTVTLAVIGCQNYEAGYYTGYDYLSQESNIDVVYFYGDYIYEGGIGHGSSRGYDDLRVSLPERRHVNEELFTLEDYRIRYAQYKSDPHLQKLHTVFPFIVTFDDHEIVNNWGGMYNESGMSEKDFLKRRAAAFQAWYEHLPVRNQQKPQGINIVAHRYFDFGNLFRLTLLDARQHRSMRLCTKTQLKNNEQRCRKESDASETMLGADQEKWLEQTLAHSKSWNVLASQVMVMPYDRQKKVDGKVSISGKDTWDGYPTARKRLIASLKKHSQHSHVFLTGDIHEYFVGVVPENPEDFSSPAIATELLTTSITSCGDGVKVRPGQEHLLERNPHMQFFSDQRGYQLVTFTPQYCIAELKVLDSVEKPNGKLSTAAKFRIYRGNPIPQKI